MLKGHMLALIPIALLIGCGSQGYVESDIPGVAESLGARAIARNTARTCPNYGAGYGAFDRSLTSSDFIRTRVDYAFVCE